MPPTPELDQALFHGSSIGGACPKALIQEADTKYVAKFSSSTDLYSVVKAEFIAMRLAERAGLNVAPVKLARAANKEVLLIERFDRVLKGEDISFFLFWARLPKGHHHPSFHSGHPRMSPTTPTQPASNEKMVFPVIPPAPPPIRNRTIVPIL